MINANTLFLGALVMVIAAFLIYKNKKGKGHDIEVAAPLSRRTDLLYGYYGCELGQPEEVRGHVNLHWECQFRGMAKAASDINFMATTTVLDLSPQLFTRVADKGKNFGLSWLAMTNTLEVFEYLQSKGALKYVKALVILDEPNTNARSAEELNSACDIARLAAARYPELIDVKLVCVYAAKPESFTCIERFDWVGVDDYDQKSSVLQGSHQALLAAKRPDAKTILLPGGAFGQDPTPFVNWAQAHTDVVAVVPFCWFGPREPADKWVGIGANAALRDRYIDAGKQIAGVKS